jgi:hypothetical protein
MPDAVPTGVRIRNVILSLGPWRSAQPGPQSIRISSLDCVDPLARRWPSIAADNDPCANERSTSTKHMCVSACPSVRSPPHMPRRRRWRPHPKRNRMGGLVSERGRRSAFCDPRPGGSRRRRLATRWHRDAPLHGSSHGCWCGRLSQLHFAFPLFVCFDSMPIILRALHHVLLFIWTRKVPVCCYEQYVYCNTHKAIKITYFHNTVDAFKNK